LKALYGECNAFSRIEGLSNCRSLRSLFLQENCIKRIEGLENCPDLWNLNLSNNFIERIEGLAKVQNLNTLTIAKNRIGVGGVEDVIELAGTTINCLDIQDNLIWDPDIVPEVLMQMPELRVLYLKGNPCTKRIPNYRKTSTVCCKDLKYLDDRPVFPEDRRAADAFNRGGLEEERAERRRIREENSAKHEANMKAFNDMIEATRRQKREKDAMRAEDKFTDETDPVESPERRMRRQIEKWKEEHADEIRDDAREHAERCLAQERREQAPPPETTDVKAAEANDAKAGSETTNRKGTEEAEASSMGLVAEDVRKEDEKEKGEPSKNEEAMQDSRKLVYEDIWDDVTSSRGTAPNAMPLHNGNTQGRGPAAATEASNQPVPDRRTQMPDSSRLQDSLQQSSGQEATWYSRYAAKAQAAHPDSEAPDVVPPPKFAFSPPVRTSAASSGTVQISDLSEMDCAD